MQGYFLFMKWILPKEKVFFYQINGGLLLKKRGVFKKLVRKDQVYAFHLFLLQRSLQYFTSSQCFSHFLRHEKGRRQTGHVFWGRCCFFITTIYSLSLSPRAESRGWLFSFFSIRSRLRST